MEPLVSPLGPFDRRRLRRRRDRAAAGFATYDFLHREAAQRLADRLADIARAFPLALNLGCHGGQAADPLRQTGKIGRLLQADLSPAMAAMAQGNGATSFVADEEFLPLAPASLDLVVSSLNLHLVNDLPGALLQIRQALKPDGLFLAALIGGDSLGELAESLIAAESSLRGGAAMRLGPFLDLQTAAGLLQRAGFALPVADAEKVALSYGDPLRLLKDLRGMGESALLRERRPFGRDLMAATLADYMRRHRDDAGQYRAHFQLIFLAGWAPHSSQQQPLRPGSARSRLADALDATEIPAGEKPPRAP